MAIVKIHKKENPFIMIDKQGIEDNRLSWGASGLLTYLIGRPDNWEISIAHLSGVKTDKKAATKTALNELRQFNYCHYFEIRVSGRVKETTYLIFETPTDHEEAQNLIEIKEGETILYKPMKSTTNSSSSPKTDFPLTEKPLTENQPLIIIDNNNKDLNNNKTCNMSIPKETKKPKLGTNKKGFPIQDKWEKFLIENLPGIDYQIKIQNAIAKLEKNHSESYIQKYLIETYTNGLSKKLSLKVIAEVITKGNVISSNDPKTKKIDTKLQETVTKMDRTDIKNKNIEKANEFIEKQKEDINNLDKQKSNIVLTPELELKAIEILKKQKIDIEFYSKNRSSFEIIMKTALRNYDLS